jgi:hypothetical protein
MTFGMANGTQINHIIYHDIYNRSICYLLNACTHGDLQYEKPGRNNFSPELLLYYSRYYIKIGELRKQSVLYDTSPVYLSFKNIDNAVTIPLSAKRTYTSAKLYYCLRLLKNFNPSRVGYFGPVMKPLA